MLMASQLPDSFPRQYYPGAQQSQSTHKALITPPSSGLLARLHSWVQQGILTGYALLSVQGVLGDVVGPLCADLCTAGKQQETGLPVAALQFLRPFTSLEPNTQHFCIAGVKLLVVQQEPAALVAVGPRRQLCACVLQLHDGVVLVATWGRSTPPPSARQLLQQLC